MPWYGLHFKVCLLSVLSTEKVHGKNVWKIDSQIIQTAAGRLHTLKVSPHFSALFSLRSNGNQTYFNGSGCKT